MALTIAIAGAGIAGLAAASFLARQGHAIHLFDKAPAPAPVGSGLVLQPVGMAVLAALGQDRFIAAHGRRIDRLYGRVMPADRVVLDVSYARAGRRGAHGLAVHRACLFRALSDAAGAAGVATIGGVEIAGIEQGRGGLLLETEAGRREGPFDLVIDAAGVRSPLAGPGGRDLAYGALWANLNWPENDAFDGHTLEQRYWRASCMAGVLPVGRLPDGGAPLTAFFWSLKQADWAAWRAAPLDEWKERVCALWPQTASVLAQIGSHDDLIMARYRHRTLRRPVEGRLVHMGDAFHATSPQLGQGANMALLDALALATAMARQVDPDAALGEYARLRAVHIRLYQLISLMFTPFYQSDSRALAWGRDHLLSRLSRLVLVRWLLSAMVCGELAAPLATIGAMPDAAEKPGQ